jgi:hypothetical protein
LSPSENILGNNSKTVIPKRKAPLNDRINFSPRVFIKGKNRANITPAMAPIKGRLKSQ